MQIYSYLRYTDRLLDVFSLLLAVTSKLLEKPRRKGWVTEKKSIEEFRLSLFWLHALLPMSFFVAFFAYSVPFVYFDFTWRKVFVPENDWSIHRHSQISLKGKETWKRCNFQAFINQTTQNQYAKRQHESVWAQKTFEKWPNRYLVKFCELNNGGFSFHKKLIPENEIVFLWSNCPKIGNANMQWFG